MANAENSDKSSGAEMSTVSENLDYLIHLTSELRAVAEQAGLNRLGLILNLAEQEARQQQRKHPVRLR